ncbi:MAG: bifunctional oligoribonuclease/PAP phosphatase NrnA [Deltaproteobacteria bacterium]|jgi:phosphoesterase RecJ-like protein|nr:bifunctional oligoribonuclease/PAP phosphatase NrnA [Deltaproteobacteria bacterium]
MSLAYDRVEPPLAALSALTEAKRVLIMGHENPDGDSLGSSMALARALSQLGKDVTVGYQGRLYHHLLFLLEDAPAPVALTRPEDLVNYPLLVLVDCPHPNRVWPGFEDLSLLPPWLIIDHHPTQPPQVGPLAVFHHPGASSTGELAFQVIEKLGVIWERNLAEALLAAIMSDTGFFSQSNVTAESFRQASVLVAAGARCDFVVNRIKRNWTGPRVKLLRLALATLEVTLSGHLASMLLSQAMLEEAGATLDDMEGFVEYPRSMAGTEVAALFRVDGHGHTRVSLRSSLNFSVREIAEYFGGGGHHQAAAYTDLTREPAEARERFMARAKRFLSPR